MDGFAIVDKGLEDIAEEEIRSKIKSKGKTEETIVKFKISSEKDLCKLAYTCQSTRRILLFLAEIKTHKQLHTSINALKKKLTKTKLKKYVSKKIVVECERLGEHDFNSVDFAKETTKILKDMNYKISRGDCEVTVYLYVYNDKCYLGIDFSGRDLSKRSYRIFTKAGSLKGTLGYALIKLAKYITGETLIDPYCESGIMAIEAALMALNKPVNYYKKEFAFKKINSAYKKVFEKEDKKIKKKIKGLFAYDKLLRNINNSKKNAKIAGVEKNINFSKVELDWLDTKFEKDSVDKIVTKFPSESKRLSKNIVEKIYKELFYQAKFILKKEGLLVVCSLKDELLKKIANKENFIRIELKQIFSGKQAYYVSIFKKVYKPS